MDKLLVIGEIKDGVLRHVTFEAIAAAKKINANGEIVGVLCGSSDLNSQAQEMIYYGADRVVVVEHENLEHYTSEGYSQAVMAVIKDESPDGIIMGHTSIGNDLTPNVASKSESARIADATATGVTEDQVPFALRIYSANSSYKRVI